MGSGLRNLVGSIYYNPAVQHGVRTAYAVAGRDRKLISRYFKQHPVRKLQLGAGRNLKAGWLNTNWFPIPLRRTGQIFLDATAPFPFEDNSFDYIFSEHMIEHVPHPGGAAMLRECLRVLKPSGKLRLSTPNLDFLLNLQRPDLSPLQQSYIKAQAQEFPPGVPANATAVLNRFVRDWGHQFIYDRVTLEDLLVKTGFQEITPCKISVSGDPVLCGLENVDRMANGFLELESMIYEARKSG